MEPLPAYDEECSPKYEKEQTGAQFNRNHPDAEHSRNWRTQLVVSTSGLGVAMSEESLRSLKYCLSWIRWANGKLRNVIVRLEDILSEPSSQSNQQPILPSIQPQPDRPRDGSGSDPSRFPHHPTAIAQRIHALQAEATHTLRRIIDIISTHAGSALPENARHFVRQQLEHLPDRWRRALPSSISHRDTDRPSAEEHNPAAETAANATKVMVLAREGLGMMAQVSHVLDGTIQSAEAWIERLGRRKDEAGGGDSTRAEKAGEGAGRDGGGAQSRLTTEKEESRCKKEDTADDNDGFL